MSAENVETVRRVYDAAARRDVDAVLALYDPNVELDNTRLEIVDDAGGVYHGHGGLRHFFREWHEAWESIEYDYDELIDAGPEKVVSVVTRRARGRASGAEVELRVALVWTIRDEKVVRVVWFPTKEEAMQAAGGAVQPTSRRKVDVVRAIYEEWEKGNLGAGLDLYDPDVMFIPLTDVPDTGRFVGAEEVKKWMRHWLEAWTDFTMAAEEFLESGDSVVVSVRQRGVGKGSGVPAEVPYFQVWTFRGPTVIRLEQFTDRSQALEAVGLSE